jgi:cytolysin (calcineurin-like family phosphatase)
MFYSSKYGALFINKTHSIDGCNTHPYKDSCCKYLKQVIAYFKTNF